MQTFLTRGRILWVLTATLLIVGLGLGAASMARSSCDEGGEGTADSACPSDPVGPHGQAVSDQFYLAHQPLGRTGSITVRMVSMTGTITYPPPNHNEIVAGLVPWAKAGIIIKDGLAQGSAYAALMMTGKHGVRMQYNYTNDIAGGVSADAPRWLRLTRSGDTITGYESADGVKWAQVGAAVLPGLPETVRVGLFATSPGDLTLRSVGLGSIAEVRFTQASGVFDNVSVDGGAGDGQWSHGSVGRMGHTDWEKHHRAPGLVESGGTLTVTGSGDIGPAGEMGGYTVEDTLIGLVFGMIVLMVVAVRFARAGAAPLTGRTLVAKAGVTGAVTVLSGLIAAAIVVPLGMSILRANGNPVVAAPFLTQMRVIVGVAVLVGAAAVFAFGLGALLRRTWMAILVALGTVVLPYAVSAVPLLPDDVARWLLRLTPAAGFAVQQTTEAYPQVVAHYAPATGFFPLAWWAGLGVLVCYAALVLALAAYRLRRPEPGARWR